MIATYFGETEKPKVVLQSIYLSQSRVDYFVSI